MLDSHGLAQHLSFDCFVSFWRPSGGEVWRGGEGGGCVGGGLGGFMGEGNIQLELGKLMCQPWMRQH